jgi:hypothetical protein
MRGTWLLVLVLTSWSWGCGGSSKGTIDAATHGPDAPASIDASTAVDAPPSSPDAAAPLPVDVQVWNGTPVAGADVVWNDATGAVIAHDLTDATGHASRILPPGASVTAIISVGIGGPYVRKVETVLDVRPGDVLTLGDRGPSSSYLCTAHVIFPGTFPGAASYRAHAIGAIDQTLNASPLDLGINTNGVEPSGDFSVIAEALDGTGTVIATSSISVPAPAPMATVDVMLPAWRSDFTSLAVDVVHGAPSLGHQELISMLGTYGALEIYQRNGNLDASGATDQQFATFDVDVGIQYGVTVAIPNGWGAQIGSLQPSATSLAVDCDDWPGAVTGSMFDVPPGQLTPRATFTIPTDGMPATGIVFSVMYQDPMGYPLIWYLAAPATVALPVQFPQLPDVLAADRTPTANFSLEKVWLMRSPTLFPDQASFRRWFGVFSDGLRPPTPYSVFLSYQ